MVFSISTCGWVQTRLALLAGDDLIGPERRRAERHLVGCPDCRRHLSSLGDTMRVLRAAAEVPAIPPPGVTPSLWPDVARQIRESRRNAPSPWARLLASPSFALAATLLLTVTGGLVAGFFQERPDTRQTVATRTDTTAPEAVLLTSPRPDRDDDEPRDTFANQPPSLRPDGDHAVQSRPMVEDTR